jgi:hypothetical protein
MTSTRETDIDMEVATLVDAALVADAAARSI